MKKILEWSFPVGLLLAWLVASSYTLVALASMPVQQPPRAASGKSAATRT